MNLNKGQIKALRAEAHRLKLKPVVMIGQHGLSDNVQIELDVAIAHHELAKIRIPANQKTDKKRMIDDICNKHQATLIQSIGNVIVLYRRNLKIDRFAKLVGG